MKMNLQKLGKALAAVVDAAIAERKAKARYNELRGKPLCAGLSYGWSEPGADGSGVDGSIQAEIPLADYLAQFPDAKPQLRQWENEGKRNSMLSYPNRFAAWIREPKNGKPGIAFWVHAYSETVEEKMPESKPDVAAEVAA